MPSVWSRNTLAKDVIEELKDEIFGKTVLITGPSIGGLGFEAIHGIAKYAKLVILVGRTAAKLQLAEDKILADYPHAKVRTFVANIESFKSIRAAAAEINALGEPIHVVIASAVTYSPTYILTEDGHEQQFAADHLGHFLLIKSIFPLILAARPSSSSPASSSGFAPRVIAISSRLHTRGTVHLDDLTFANGAEYTMNDGYANAKSANMLFVKELARRGEGRGVLAFSVHPGTIQTNGFDSVPEEQKKTFGILNADGTPNETFKLRMKEFDQGATAYIVAAFDPRIKDQSGSYVYEDGQIQNDQIAPHANDPDTAKRLWEMSEKFIEETLDV